jgi:hypothetical protein
MKNFDETDTTSNYAHFENNWQDLSELLSEL